jgi:hypothetical protein
MGKKTLPPDKNQVTMFPELARPIEPDKNITEPQLWFKELRLLKKLHAEEGSDAYIRKIEFRPGLNVLWAEPEPADSELTISGLYADGFSGHATGKTLFCRILRYLIGDTSFATKSDLAGIQGQFIELWAVAEIRLAGKSWIVGRALTGPGEDFAISGTSLDEALATSTTLGAYQTFRTALENSPGATVQNLYPADGWRYLLPWLTRDQESRFSGINAWRDSLSEADHPRETSERQHLLMRTVLNLLEKEEFDLREMLDAWQEEEKRCAEKIPNKRNLADNDARALKSTLANVEGIELELKDLESDKAQITTHIEVRQEALKKFQDIPESNAVKKARETYEETTLALTRSRDRIEFIDKTEIPALIKEQEQTMGYVEQIKTKGVKDPTRVDQNYCPNSIQFAREKGCVDLPDDESQFEVSTLEEKARQLTATIESRRTEKASIESKLDQLEAAKETARTELNQIRNTENRDANRSERAIALLENAERQAERAIKSANEVEDLRSKKQKATNEIEQTKKQLTEVKQEVEGRRKQFSAIFSDVVGAILGNSVTAWVDINERGLSLKAERNGNLGGTALATIKTIAFDLAAIIQSIEGQGKHPRFLIHDGPREGDMARIVYGRLFLLARHIEEAFLGNPASFQYILTTTTPPPDDMQEGSEWLLCEPMKGSDKTLKLLKTDF